MAAANQLKKTGATKKLSISGQINNQYDVYSIPLKYLYYNNQNGRINTTYKQYQANHKEELKPKPGDSEYNRQFEKLIYNSNVQALKDTLDSIKSKTQQEPAVVLPDGRVIDGNRRFTALRMYERQDGIPKNLEAIILPLDIRSDEKSIKELELDLQLGREERVSYDPIDRIFDVYNTIEVKKLMNADEYRKASGTGNVVSIKNDLYLAELILRFIGIVSPDGDPVDKFYLARDLQIDGPIEEVGRKLLKLKDDDKEAIIDATLVQLIAAKSGVYENTEPKLVMRQLKTHVLGNPDVLEHYLDAVDDKVDAVIETFEDTPIHSSNDLKKVVDQDVNLKKQIEKLKSTTDRLIYKGKKDSKRVKVLTKLENIRDDIEDISVSEFSLLTVDENLEAKDVMRQINDDLFKLKKEWQDDIL